MKIKSAFLIITLVAFGTHSYGQAIFAPGDPILGGQSDGTDFLVGQVGTAGGVNNWPGGEGPEHAIDGVGQKYLNFAEFNTGFLATPSAGSTVAGSAQFWTANDAVPRDPTGYEIWGTNDLIDGDSIPLSLFSPISTGTLDLPDSRNSGGDSPLLGENSQTVSFDNSAAYTSYLVLFPDVKDSASANSMQIAEVQMHAQVRRYDVNKASTAPTIDGVVSGGEWDSAAPASGDWVLLRTAAPGDPDGENSRFQMLWDADNLYLLYQSDYGGWNGVAGGGMNFNADNLNLYFDPNTDGEANVDPPDAYQLAFNQPPGTTTVADTPKFTEAHVNAGFGNQGAPWSDFANMDLTQVNDGVGGTVEIAIPWGDFNAAETHPDDTGLFHPMAPQVGDEWYLNLARISSDSGNFLPIWQFNSTQSFTFRPDGVIAFVPEPGTMALAMIGLFGLVWALCQRRRV